MSTAVRSARVELFEQDGKYIHEPDERMPNPSRALGRGRASGRFVKRRNATLHSAEAVYRQLSASSLLLVRDPAMIIHRPRGR